MGTGCSSCLKGDETVVVQPDTAARRQMQMEAAERRRQESENRGIKNPEKVRQMQERTARIEKQEIEAAKMGEPTLRWTSD
ncbi:uncharacterized protein LOC116342687 [Contarinia nasturtii]|uniref:uncharacterized protein LOC116342687 n=1 Tax=Contarinia nasturtii TaxID=265458 RepID=UPI0012D4656A|nr:uncharacterized protein LOC116342687 [Contarinia nasturtii]XP_031626260.1 uncharacterized protein LOC116342687 [Contarinia nasturtii]